MFRLCAMIRPQVSSAAGWGNSSVPQTSTPLALAAARSMAALRMPVVTSSFSSGRRSNMSAGKGVRSRMATMTG